MTHKIYRKVALVILDGFGVASFGRGNAVAQANTANFTYLTSHYPSTTLQASGPLVGLPWGEMGNSEVGHLNIGAGRVVGMDLPKINAQIQDGKFFTNPVLLEACEHVKNKNSRMHLVGMVSNGNVHSSDEHLFALMALAKDKGVREVYIHMFTDGRDTAERYALESIAKLNDRIARIGIGKIATISGRFYSMDRGGHWSQTVLTYDAMVKGEGEKFDSPEKCIETNYSINVFDEMIKPSVIQGSDGSPVVKVSENDAIIFFNFRQDRALQLTKLFVDPTATGLSKPPALIPGLFFVTMTEYLPGLPVKVVFDSESFDGNLAQVLANNKLTQFHIAESEKFAHVTSFFNCGISDTLPGEERVIVQSPNNAKNYSDQPGMSAEKLTDILCEKILKTETNFFLANFANGDMVGHTGDLIAATKAVEVLDLCIGKIYKACMQANCCLIITADHGNCERMIDPTTGQIDKDHTTNPVPFIIASNEFRFAKSREESLVSLAAKVPDGVISDVAPTVLDLFGVPKPKEMTAVNLLNLI